MTEEPLRIAIVGRTNVGKSSIVNRLVGEERLIVERDPRHDPRQHRHADRPRRQALLPRRHGRHPQDGFDRGRPGEGGHRPGQVQHPPGRRRLSRPDVQEFPDSQDARIAQLALDSGRPPSSSSTNGISSTRTPCGPTPSRSGSSASSDSSPTRRCCSSRPRTGQRIVKILDTAEEVYRGGTIRVETSKLNDFLARTTEEHPPRLKSGARAKLRYITQKGVSPPTFILFLGARGPLSPTYEKHFLESLRQEFGFYGTPLRLIVRTS